MTIKKSILTAVFLGSLFTNLSQATPINFSTLFEPQQGGAPGTFTLSLEDNYRLVDGQTFLKFSLLQVQSAGPPESRITGIFMQDRNVVVAGGFYSAIMDGNFQLNNRGPRAVPASIEEAFDVQYWFPLIEGTGVYPGGLFQLAADPSSHSLIDEFNLGNLKVGIQLADGHTYIAAVPESFSTIAVAAAAFGLVCFFRHAYHRNVF